MSLIERAVSRLSGAESLPREDGTPADDAHERHAKASSIEAAMERASRAGAVAGPAESAERPQTVAPLEIDLASLRERGFVTPDVHDSQTAGEFRIIKRPLVRNAFGTGAAPVRNGKRIMVTSAFPGEGKSFCAINLALSIAAERDHKVLLVDADVARPSVPRELGVTTDAGLMDLLLDAKLDPSSLVRPTNIDKLSILPAGRRHQQATELLASAAMSRLLEQLSTRFPDRVLIFDSPPLLLTTEARVLASYMGQIVMVVEAGKTPKEAVKEALATIEGAEVVAMVLNKARTPIGSGYGGYYGYGYGYGHA